MLDHFRWDVTWPDTCASLYEVSRHFVTPHTHAWRYALHSEGLNRRDSNQVDWAMQRFLSGTGPKEQLFIQCTTWQCLQCWGPSSHAAFE